MPSGASTDEPPQPDAPPSLPAHLTTPTTQTAPARWSRGSLRSHLDRRAGAQAARSRGGLGREVPAFAWICGEQAMVREVRRHVVTDLGLDRRRVAHPAWWILGRP